MKKCASCTKDLPDAALHCVFCGAKQAPAAAPAATAKTVMGYGGPEIEALRAQAAAQNAARPAGPSQPPPSGPASMPGPAQMPRPAGPSQPPPGMGNAATLASPGQSPGGMGMGNAATLASPGQGPTGMAPAAGGSYGQPLAPASHAQARTMFVDNGPPGALPSSGPGSSPPPQAGVFNVPPPSPATLASHQPLPFVPQQPAPGPAPIAPVAAASPPYLASQTAARAGRPIEPWKDSLPLMMFIFGALLIAAFVTPLSTDPMSFNWDAIIHGEGSQKLPPLILAAVGLLTVVMAAIPLGAGVRGTMALLLGVTGVFVPQLIAGMPPWQTLLSTVGMILLPMSLLARSEYRDAALPRILITVGAICYALPFVLPVNGSLILVELFKAIIEAPGALKIVMLLMIGQFVLVVLSLLCWLPSPSGSFAKPIAWMLILYPLVTHMVLLFVVGDPSSISHTPNQALLGWVTGLAGAGSGSGGADAGMMAMFSGLGVGVAYLALTGYGGASVLGKNLE